MTCFEAQSRITPFINNELTVEELEEFLYHINHCSECMDELEVYYTLFTGMKLLDEQKNLGNNFHQEFENLLRQSEDKIVRKKIRIIRNRILFGILVVIIAVLII